MTTSSSSQLQVDDSQFDYELVQPGERRRIWLKPHEREVFESVSSWPRTEDAIMVRLQTRAGLRGAEAAAVTYGNVQAVFDEGTLIHIVQVPGTKTKAARRWSYIDPETYGLIMALRQERGLGPRDPIYVPTKTGASLTPTQVARAFNVRLQTLAMKHGFRLAKSAATSGPRTLISSHDLRRTWATRRLNSDLPIRFIKVIKHMGGWRSWDAMEPYWEPPTYRTAHELMQIIEAQELQRHVPVGRTVA